MRLTDCEVPIVSNNEGPLQARQYEIYGLSERDIDATPQDPTLVSGQTIFFVEATSDFNLNNVDYGAIPTVNDPSNTTNGYSSNTKK